MVVCYKRHNNQHKLFATLALPETACLQEKLNPSLHQRILQSQKVSEVLRMLSAPGIAGHQLGVSLVVLWELYVRCIILELL